MIFIVFNVNILQSMKSFICTGDHVNIADMHI